MRELKETGIITAAAHNAASTLTPERRHSQVEIEQSLDQLSRWMDGIFRVPGTGWRFGLDAIVGLIPGIGDTATTIVGFYILAAGVRYRVSKVTLLRMGLNIGVDYIFGAIPVLGDLFDAAWKSNQKNVELLRQRATVNAADAHKGRLSDWLFVGLVMLCLLALLVGSIMILWFILRFLADAFATLF
ncbi:MAG TPA: DUF4112 domain-containing protein [Pyrinomonadaceae bacterium]|nr:DUF4112 domain-containing protein [Pyrinomonadaceae bacterium]